MKGRVGPTWGIRVGPTGKEGWGPQGRKGGAHLGLKGRAHPKIPMPQSPKSPKSFNSTFQNPHSHNAQESFRGGNCQASRELQGVKSVERDFGILGFWHLVIFGMGPTLIPQVGPTRPSRWAPPFCP